MWGLSSFMMYLVIINIAGFILYLVNTPLYRMTADGQIDAVITVVSLLGGSLGIVISILIFDRKSEKENEARNKKIEEILRKFKAREYDALKAEIAQNEYSGEDGYYSEDDIEIKGDKLVLDILENEELTKEEADLLKDFMKDQVSKIKNMPEFVTRIENACK